MNGTQGFATRRVFLGSMAADLTRRFYRTEAETLEYVYGSAEVIGLFMARIMRLPEEALPAARMLGRAMQFINFIRDAAEDAVPRPDFVDSIDGEYNKVWRCTLGAGEAWRALYTGTGEGTLDLRGVDDGMKVVVDLAGNALYFSRSLIPYPRESTPHAVYEHIGLYAYRKEFLIAFTHLAPTTLEQVESLEQLRALEHGYRIRTVETKCADNEFSGFSIDTAKDIEHAEAMLRERGLE